jgi:hypothetical protein
MTTELQLPALITATEALQVTAQENRVVARCSRDREEDSRLLYCFPGRSHRAPAQKRNRKHRPGRGFPAKNTVSKSAIRSISHRGNNHLPPKNEAEIGTLPHPGIGLGARGVPNGTAWGQNSLGLGADRDRPGGFPHHELGRHGDLGRILLLPVGDPLQQYLGAAFAHLQQGLANRGQ